MHEVLVNRLGGLSLPRKSVVRLTDRPDMTLHVDVYRGRKTIIQYVAIFFFLLRCVLQTVEIKKNISAPYTVYRVPLSDVRLVFLHSLYCIKFTRVNCKRSLKM